jgi:3-oxo-5alpha-steroid 4-dehydrogenase
VNLYLNGRNADTLRELAVRIGVPPEQMEATLHRYNDDAGSDTPDLLGKASHLVEPLVRPPFRAIPVHLNSTLFPAPTITLGGLDVDNLTQQVRRVDGSAIEGLLAVGRCAAGIASRSYVSGLSVADCIFSGRNAGQHLVAEHSRAAR